MLRSMFFRTHSSINSDILIVIALIVSVLWIGCRLRMHLHDTPEKEW